MAKVTNLNRFRKSKLAAEKQQQAEENRVRFGRTKADRQISETRQARTREHLEGHKLDKDDD